MLIRSLKLWKPAYGMGWWCNLSYSRNYQWCLIHDPMTMPFVWAQGDEEGAMMAASDECWEKGRAKWDKVTPQKYRDKKKLVYDRACGYFYSGNLRRSYFGLTNGNILIVDQKRISRFSHESYNVYRLYISELNKGFEVDINTFEDDCLSCDLNFIAAEATKFVGKTVGRYILPIEDVYILLEGKDFDGNQANRAVATGFILIEFIPGGKILKPVTKGLKAGTKATVKGSRKIYTFVRGSKVVVGEFADDVLKPARWIDGEADEVLETLNNVTYIGKDGKQAKGTVQVVKQGSKVGFKKAISTLDEFWAQIPAQFRKQVQEAFEAGTVQLKYADDELTLFRHISQDGAEKSFWYARLIQSPQNARKFYALPSANNADWVVKVKVKKGTPFIEGKVASQVGNKFFGDYATGGGSQIYFLQEYFDDIQIVGEKFINPLK